jgi:CheY-like chemotaxis protein
MPSTRQILLVDDDRSIREVARASLELVGGYEVVTASSGEECLELSRLQPPEAILLDVMMPGLSGPATFARLQEQAETRHVPVVLLTAKTQEADRRHFAELGVAGVLSKPFDPMRLPGQIAELLGWHQ